jgi:hypothetical protein
MNDYHKEFAQAMQLKLKLNRQALKGYGESFHGRAPSAPKDDFRDGLIHQILSRHPGLTREELVQAMTASGF